MKEIKIKIFQWLADGMVRALGRIPEENEEMFFMMYQRATSFDYYCIKKHDIYLK